MALLLESGDALLLEDGGRFLLEAGRGQELRSSAGLAAVAVTLALVGASIGVEAGTLIGSQQTESGQDVTVALVGQASVAQQGSVGKSTAGAVEGLESASGQGAVVGTRAKGISGLGLVSAQQQIGPVGDDVTVVLSGVESESQLGVVGQGIQLQGIVLSASAGTPVATYSRALVGSGLSAAIGDVVAGQDDGENTFLQSSSGLATANASVALVGSAVATQTGTLYTNDGEGAAVGILLAVELEPIEAALYLELSGQGIASAQGQMGAPGFAALTGVQTTLEQGDVFLTGDRTFGLTGQAMTVGQGVAFASSIAFYTGQTITTDLQGIGPRTVELVGLEVAVQPGHVAPPVVEVVRSGGWPMWGGRRRTKQEEDEDRIKFGVLPAPVQTAIVKAAKKVVREAKNDRALEADVLVSDAPVVPYVRAEVQKTRRKFNPEHAKLAADIARRALEAEAQELNEVWELWNRM